MIVRYDELPLDTPIDRSPVVSVAYSVKPDHVLMLGKFYGCPMNHQDNCTPNIGKESRRLLECTRHAVYLVSHSSGHLQRQTHFPVGRPGPALTGESSSIMLSTSSPF